MQVKRIKFQVQNIRFYASQKILSSFTLSQLYCLATREIKAHTKQSGGTQILTTTWLWKISMWSLYYHHILADGKLGGIESNKA